MCDGIFLKSIILTTFGWLSPVMADDLAVLRAFEDRVRAPGPQQEQVIEVLRAISQCNSTSNSPTENLLLEGRLSFVQRGWDKSADATLDTTAMWGDMPEPEWRHFLLVTRGEKRRFETEATQDWAQEISGGKTYRLCDGDAFYALNPNSLDIMATENFEGKWSDIIYSFSAFLQVHDGKAFGTVPEVCETHIRRLKVEGGEYFREMNREISCYKSNDGRIAVEVGPKPGNVVVTKAVFWVDPSVGGRLVGSELQQGNAGGGRYNLTETRVSYKVVSENFIVPNRGVTRFFKLGEAAKRDGRAGWGKREVDITRIEVGQFEYDNDNFEVDSLPIPVGAVVTDHRTSPPVYFNYRRSPLDEQILQRAADARKLAEGAGYTGLRTVLLAINVLLILLFGTAFFLRQMRRRKQ